jgi:hypothetical protein
MLSGVWCGCVKPGRRFNKEIKEVTDGEKYARNSFTFLLDLLTSLFKIPPAPVS